MTDEVEEEEVKPPQYPSYVLGETKQGEIVTVHAGPGVYTDRAREFPLAMHHLWDLSIRRDPAERQRFVTAVRQLYGEDIGFNQARPRLLRDLQANRIHLTIAPPPQSSAAPSPPFDDRPVQPLQLTRIKCLHCPPREKTSSTRVALVADAGTYEDQLDICVKVQDKPPPGVMKAEALDLDDKTHTKSSTNQGTDSDGFIIYRIPVAAFAGKQFDTLATEIWDRDTWRQIFEGTLWTVRGAGVPVQAAVYTPDTFRIQVSLPAAVPSRWGPRPTVVNKDRAPGAPEVTETPGDEPLPKADMREWIGERTEGTSITLYRNWDDLGIGVEKLIGGYLKIIRNVRRGLAALSRAWRYAPKVGYYADLSVSILTRRGAAWKRNQFAGEERQGAGEAEPPDSTGAGLMIEWCKKEMEDVYEVYNDIKLRGEVELINARAEIGFGLAGLGFKAQVFIFGALSSTLRVDVHVNRPVPRDYRIVEIITIPELGVGARFQVGGFVDAQAAITFRFFLTNALVWKADGVHLTYKLVFEGGRATYNVSVGANGVGGETDSPAPEDGRPPGMGKTVAPDTGKMGTGGVVASELPDGLFEMGNTTIFDGSVNLAGAEEDDPPPGVTRRAAMAIFDKEFHRGFWGYAIKATDAEGNTVLDTADVAARFVDAYINFPNVDLSRDACVGLAQAARHDIEEQFFGYHTRPQTYRVRRQGQWVETQRMVERWDYLTVAEMEGYLGTGFVAHLNRAIDSAKVIASQVP